MKPTKRPLLFTLIFFFFTPQIYSQSPGWLWAKSAGGIHNEEAKSIATDASGNVYATGYFASDSITFGSITLVNPHGGEFNTFLVKYDSQGNVLWAKSPRGTGGNEAYSVGVDASGNSYITGVFTNPLLIFGSDTATYYGGSTIFLAKFDVNGNFLWVRSAGGGWFDFSYSVAVDASGNICIAGSYSSPSISFGAYHLINLINSGSSNDLFIAKYDSNGNVIWARRAGGTKNDIGYSIATDHSGNVYISGGFTSHTISFDTITFTNPNANFFNLELFVVKYNATGNVVWAKSAGGVNSDQARSIAVDTADNVYIAGSFSSPTITFDTITLNTPGSDVGEI